jgi:predicted helicase
VKIEAQHVDGKTNVKVRSEAIAWLEEPPGQGVCRVLSNAKCLTEGVDVPALDAVLFLQPRKSIVDVVQAVGRVMRLAPDKEFGYVVLPVAIPAGVAPEDALRNQKSYQVVWQVLQALRSHDERLAAEINKIDINKTSSKVEVIGIGLGNGGDDPANPGEKITTTTTQSAGTQLELPDLHEWHDAIYARIVEKVGNRRYMESWAPTSPKSQPPKKPGSAPSSTTPTKTPSRRTFRRVPHRVAEQPQRRRHPRRRHWDAVPASDHPAGVRSALRRRPVHPQQPGVPGHAIHDRHPRRRQPPIRDRHPGRVLRTHPDAHRRDQHRRGPPEGHHRAVREVLQTGAPQTVEALGIVYTPIEIVDFINRSVNDLLIEHFDGTTLSDEGVHVLDPFTGTGTFITRLLQTGLINPADLARKYASELHANEIMLLAYYIAAINIETTYNTLTRVDGYQPFEGIVLTDTFQLAEDGDPMDAVFFPSNNARADHQKGLDIRVIVGNPPYSVGQTSENDNNQNLGYPTLDTSIADLRQALDRHQQELALRLLHPGHPLGIQPHPRCTQRRRRSDSSQRRLDRRQHRRRHPPHPPQRVPPHLHLQPPRQPTNQRRTITPRRRQSLRTRQPQHHRHHPPRQTTRPSPSEWRSDPLPRHRRLPQPRNKLTTIEASTVENMPWASLVPNETGDWINQRDVTYDQHLPLSGANGIFQIRSNGLQTNRDAWVYNSSSTELTENVERMVHHYNGQADAFRRHSTAGDAASDAKAAAEFVDRDTTKYSWASSDFPRVVRGERHQFTHEMVRTSLYRPFFKQEVAFDGSLNHRTYRLPKLYPTPHAVNRAIVVQQTGPAPFSVFASDAITDLVLVGAGNPTYHFARWRYEEPSTEPTLLDDGTDDRWKRVSNLNPTAFRQFQTELARTSLTTTCSTTSTAPSTHPSSAPGMNRTSRRKHPRVPMAPDRARFDAYRDAGAELMELHIGYETVEPYPLEEHWAHGADPGVDPKVLRVGDKKMRYPKVTDPETGTRSPTAPS